jgi:hypothetical protein
MRLLTNEVCIELITIPSRMVASCWDVISGLIEGLVSPGVLNDCCHVARRCAPLAKLLGPGKVVHRAAVEGKGRGPEQGRFHWATLRAPSWRLLELYFRVGSTPCCAAQFSTYICSALLRVIAGNHGRSRRATRRIAHTAPKDESYGCICTKSGDEDSGWAASAS